MLNKLLYITNITILLLSISIELQSQKQYILSIVCNNSNIPKLAKSYRSHHKSLASAIKESETLTQQLFNKGFIAANIDSTSFKKDTLKAYLYIGINYNKTELRITKSLKKELVENNLIKQKEKIFLSKYSKIRENYLEYLENKGFPFAQIWLKDSLNKLWICAEKRQQYKIGTILINGAKDIKLSYIHRQLNINEGDNYAESKILALPQLINRTGFIAMSHEPVIQFTNTGLANIAINLRKKKASQLDALISFSQNNEANRTENRLFITGNADLFLINAFKYGEELKFRWAKPLPLSQTLETSFLHKYIFSTQLGVSGFYSSHKKDSTYIKNTAGFGIPIFWQGGNFLKPLITIENSFLLINRKQNSSLYQYTKRNYGLELKLWKFDYANNPMKGAYLNTHASAGEKTNFAKSDSVKTESQFQVRLKTGLFTPIHPSITLHNSLSVAHLYSRTISVSEMYTIGGASLLRGFRENEIRASSYWIGTTELRLLFNTDSHAFLFSDYGRCWQNGIIAPTTKNVYSIGSGLRLKSRASIFTISYATGSVNNKALSLKNAIVHFGYISVF